MKEKKVIDYTRTYRRIEADKKKCILYIVILLLLGFLLMWTQIDDLTRMICKICAGVLKKYEPHMYVGIRSETYPLFGKISYLSAETVYPGIQISLINAGISLGVIYKLLTLLAIMLYSIVFGTVRYVIFIWLLYRFSVIYMAFFYFMIGPMFDFLYLVMIYAVFVNRMIGVYDSRKGEEVWKWS